MEISLENSINSSNFAPRGYLSFNQNDPVTYMHRLAVYMKPGLPFAHDLSLCIFRHSHLCSPLASTS